MRNLMNVLLTISLTLSLSACLGGGGGDAGSSRSLFSVWYSSSEDIYIDLTGLDFGVSTTTFYIDGGGYCDCTLNLIGTQSDGEAYITSCGGNLSQSVCDSFEIPLVYTKSKNTLTICDYSGCANYK